MRCESSIRTSFRVTSCRSGPSWSRSLRSVLVAVALTAVQAQAQDGFTLLTVGTNVVTGPVSSQTGFYGQATGLSNATPMLATNAATASETDLLVKSGDRLRLADRWQLAIEDALNPKFVIYTDEFCVGAHGDGTFGDTGWRVLASGGSAGTGWGTNRPCVRALKSGATAGNYYAITFHSPDFGQGYAISTLLSNWLCHFEFRLPFLATNAQFIVGVSRFAAGGATWGNPPPGIWLYVTNSAGPFRFAVKPNSADWSGAIFTNSAVAIDNGWHAVRISQTNGNVTQTYWLQVDDETPIPVTSGSFNGFLMSPYISATTGEAAGKELWIDRFVMILSPR